MFHVERDALLSKPKPRAQSKQHPAAPLTLGPVGRILPKRIQMDEVSY